MMELDDPRWSKLDGGFRPDDGIPGLLKHLDAHPESLRWTEVYTYLCHQGGTIYPVTFAAIPHIVASASKRPPHERFKHLSLVGSVERVRLTSAPVPVPEDVKSDYDSAIETSRSLLRETLFARAWDETALLYLLATCATLLGQVRLGCAIDGLDDGLACPGCGVDLGEPV